MITDSSRGSRDFGSPSQISLQNQLRYLAINCGLKMNGLKFTLWTMEFSLFGEGF